MQTGGIALVGKGDGLVVSNLDIASRYGVVVVVCHRNSGSLGIIGILAEISLRILVVGILFGRSLHRYLHAIHGRQGEDGSVVHLCTLSFQGIDAGIVVVYLCRSGRGIHQQVYVLLYLCVVIHKDAACACIALGTRTLLHIDFRCFAAIERPCYGCLPVGIGEV